MTSYKTLLTSALLFAGLGIVQAQDISWDREKFPD